MNERITIQVCTRDRSLECALLLQSLRTQTYQNWDLLVIDGSQPQTIFNLHALQSLLNRLRLEGHGVQVIGVNLPGVCHARQTAIEKDPWPDNKYVCRIDDDVLLEPDYLEKLMEGIRAGYDLVSGLTVHCASPVVIRESKFIKPIINKIETNDAGDITKFGDDCAFTYDTSELVPTHHFRSCSLYKRELHSLDGFNYRNGLSLVGFREEAWLSIRAILAGKKLAVHTRAINWHLQTPSGGVRFPDAQQMYALDDAHFRDWFKRKWQERPNFLKEYDEKVFKNV